MVITEDPLTIMVTSPIMITRVITGVTMVTPTCHPMVTTEAPLIIMITWVTTASLLTMTWPPVPGITAPRVATLTPFPLQTLKF